MPDFTDINPEDLPEIDDREPLQSNDDFSDIATRIHANNRNRLFVRDLELERDILDRNEMPQFGYYVGLYAVRQRWPEGEAALLNWDSPHQADQLEMYARNVINGRWYEAEEIISKEAPAAVHYAIEVLKGPWDGPWKEQAEASINKYPDYKRDYAWLRNNPTKKQ